MIEKSDSKWLSLAMASILGQTPRKYVYYPYEMNQSLPDEHELHSKYIIYDMDGIRRLIMTLKHLKQSSWTIEQANHQIKQEYDEQYWQFLISLINLKEVVWNVKNNTIDFAEYIPLKTLINEVLGRIQTEDFMVKKCHVCQHYFNADKEDGIFGDTEKLAHFICNKCAHSLTAWEFYQNHLKA